MLSETDSTSPTKVGLHSSYLPVLPANEFDRFSSYEMGLRGSRPNSGYAPPSSTSIHANKFHQDDPKLVEKWDKDVWAEDSDWI